MPKLIALLLLVFSFPGRADDASATAKLDAAKALYEQRSTPGKVEAALDLLEQAVGEAESDDLKYAILLFTSRCYYWQGMHAAGDQAKMKQYDRGYQVAKRARAVNSDYAEAYYYVASNLARWAEANGILASLDKKKEIQTALESVFERSQMDGSPGEAYEFYGTDRTMGRIYFKAPPFAGGSLSQALKHLQVAHANGPQVVLNWNWYAEALYQNGEKERAKQLLDEILKADPQTLNPARIPETLEELVEARKLRDEMGN